VQPLILHTPSGAASADERLPYVVLRGVAAVPYYKRRIPTELRPVVGASTITVRLQGPIHSSSRPGRLSPTFLASYSRAHQQTEQRLAGARHQLRELSAIEQLGVAGAWAKRAGPQASTLVLSQEAAAILKAADALGLILTGPIAEDWSAAAAGSHPELGSVVQELARELHFLDHPGYAPIPGGDLVWGEELPNPTVCLRYMEACVQQAAVGLSQWLERAQEQLGALGLSVSPGQRQQVAYRLANTAAALGHQEQQIQAGRHVAPLVFPDPPQGATTSLRFADAVQRWQELRDPAPKTQLDAQRRIEELQAHVGHDRLDQLTPEQVTDWRASLIAGCSTSTVRRKLALVRAVLQAAVADGMPVDQQALERLSAKGLRESGGTRQQRRPFTREEAALLWKLSRQQSGPRPFDRWAFPLGLSLGCRLEELAGLRPCDVCEIDGVWVVVIQPTEDRRLKTDSSARRIPLPEALVREGFITWAQQQNGDFLFPEPAPPAADPRRSHYASVRLAKLIRKQANIKDSTAVFHSCRHFVAQSLVDIGTEQRVIEQLMGHSSRSMTARYSRGGIPLQQLAAALEAREWSWLPT